MPFECERKKFGSAGVIAGCLAAVAALFMLTWSFSVGWARASAPEAPAPSALLSR